MSDNIYICKICGIQRNSIRAFTPHLKTHNISSKEYYDTYIKEPHEGICKDHNNNTRYLGLIKGYAKYCSNTCGNSEIAKIGWTEERKISHKKTFNPMIDGGRPLGSKNKNPYPISGRLLQSKLHKGKKAPHNKDPIKIAKQKDTWRNKSDTEIAIMMEKQMVSKIKNKTTNKSRFTQGRYTPINPKKYKGDLKKIYFRSSWELKFFKYCDLCNNVIAWNSEEIIVPYISPIDGAKHRYFPDCYVKIKNNNEIVEHLIEIKPAKETKAPKPQKRKTKRYINEVHTYVKNQAKWKAARKWCKRRGYEFKIFTERELGIK